MMGRAVVYEMRLDFGVLAMMTLAEYIDHHNDMRRFPDQARSMATALLQQMSSTTERIRCIAMIWWHETHMTNRQFLGLTT